MERLRLAIAPFLLSFPEVKTLGVRSLMGDYTQEERDWMLHAHRIFFPTVRFAEVFHAARIPCFPNVFSYRYQRSRILQTSLVSYLNFPQPHTRLYYGTRQKTHILRHFAYPFFLAGPKAGPATKHLVTDGESLAQWSGRYNPVIVQDWVPWRDRVRVIFVLFQCIGAFRYSHPSEPDSPAEPISPTRDLSETCVNLAHRLVAAARIDDVAMDWGMAEDGWQFIEMHWPAVSIQTPCGSLNRHQYVGRLIHEGVL
ncbi:MAG: hypothetical protein GX443_18090 [Deltaproteobacteria bacterium]|nr:hypothetical protein [Deltaproteobacteria bacterium]